MINFGKVAPGKTLYIPFNTFDSNDPSASVTLTGLAVTDIEIYKDGSVTQRASDNGYTLLDTDGIDFDSVTGIHGFSVSLADNTTAGFWAAGSQYWVVVSSITVDAATINFIAATFEIGYPDAVLDTTIASLSSQTSFTLTAGPAEDDALNGCVCLIHDVASAVQLGFAVVSDYTGATKTVTLTAGVSFTAAATDNISFFPPGNARWFAALATVALPLTPTTAGRTLDVSAGGEAGVDWANVGSPTTANNLSGTTIATTQKVDLETIKTQSVTAAAGVTFPTSIASPTNITAGTITTVTNLTNAPTAGDLTAAMKASVNAEVDTGLADYDAPTKAELDAADDAILAILGTPADFGSGTSTIAANLQDMADNGTATFDRSTDSLQAIRDHATTIKTDTAATLADTGTEGVVVAAASKTGYSLAAGSIITTTFGSGAIDAASLAADAANEIRDAVVGATLAELTGDPGSTPELQDAVMLLYMALRNKRETTASVDEIHNDAGAVILDADVADDNVTFSKSKYAAP